MSVPGDEGKGNTQIEFVEFDDNFDVVTRREFTTRFIVFHDWALTENYYVVPKNPAYLRWGNILQFTLGLKVGVDVFAMEEETNGEFVLIPRHDEAEDVHEVKSDAFFNCFHFGPVFERKDKRTNLSSMVASSIPTPLEAKWDSTGKTNNSRRSSGARQVWRRMEVCLHRLG